MNVKSSETKIPKLDSSRFNLILLFYFITFIMSATVSANLLQIIKQTDWGGTGIRGLLIGPKHGDPVVSSVWRTDEIDPSDLNVNIEDCLASFPCGFAVKGIVLLSTVKLASSITSGDDENLGEDLEAVIGPSDELLESIGCESCLIFCLHQTDGSRREITCLMLDKDSLKPVALSQDCDTEKHNVQMRLRAALPFLISTESKDGISNQLEIELTRFQTMLQNGSFVYGIDGNQILLLKSGVIQHGSVQKLKTCRDIQAYVLSQEEERGGGGSTVRGGGGKKKMLLKQPPISLSMLEMASSVSSTQSYAPVIAHQVGTFESIQMSLPVDVFIDVSDEVSVSKLSNLITESVSRQLKAFSECLKRYTKDGKLHSAEAFHFQPPWLDSPVTVIYPRGISEQELESERLALHRKFCLPSDRPYLRRSCGNIFLYPTAPGGYILNPHFGLPDPPVKSATVSVVSGYYSYHHYMQDHFNDDKWGCAYRSLQTIVSWFKYQGYTDKNIPSHRQIQQALHDVGDKPEKFVGSRQWIGSFEVSFVLDHLIGVSSKFINVNAGAELSTTGQQLAHHFQEQGTPVMIGGGVLAHTILGVAYDELTGDISFLILDPHYTGSEDLRTIQAKGWCGWKDMKFWNQTAHYNMCLPQRPSMV